jgi:peptidoglycan hydrolase FlgJ
MPASLITGNASSTASAFQDILSKGIGSRANAARAFAAAARAAPNSPESKARKASQDFEGTLVNNLLGSMFQGLTGEGPMGVNGTGGDTWRSMLVQEMSTAVVKSGGIGVAPQVYRDLLRVQEQLK